MRVWVPGCSTGEEAYSIAMLLRERLPPDRKRRAELQIFATDIDERALEVGRIGRYPATIAEQVGDRRLKRFFVREDGTFRVVARAPREHASSRPTTCCATRPSPSST